MAARKENGTNGQLEENSDEESIPETGYTGEDPEPTVRLKEALDLTELRNPDSKGTTFEVKEVDPNEPPDYEQQYFQSEVFKHLNDMDDESGSDSEDLGEFERLSRKMEDITEDKDGGVLKKIVRQGVQEVVPPGAIVRVHYNGYLEYGDEPYDSSYLRGQEFRFKLGNGEVIPGWDVAVSTMKKNEIAKFLITPEYAYGHQGCPPRIPQDSTIKFVIELLGFIEHAGVEDYLSLSPRERRQAPLDLVIRFCNGQKQLGKEFFKKQKWDKAVQKYIRAIRELEGAHLKDDEDEKRWKKLLLTLYINAAVCNMKLKQYSRVLYYCKQAMEIDANNVKCLFHSGKAYRNLSKFDAARNRLLRAQKLDPRSKDINLELEKLNEDMKKFQLLEKQMCQRMFAPSKKAAETKKEKEKKAKPDLDEIPDCSQEFKDLVREHLEAFKNDEEMMEMPFPASNFTMGEFCCFEEIAEELGLEIQNRGEGSETQLKILKRSPEKTS